MPRRTHPKLKSWLLSLTLAVLYCTYPWWAPLSQVAASGVRSALAVAWGAQASRVVSDDSTAEASAFPTEHTSEESLFGDVPPIPAGAPAASVEASTFSVVHRAGRAEQWSKALEVKGVSGVMRDGVRE